SSRGQTPTGARDQYRRTRVALWPYHQAACSEAVRAAAVRARGRRPAGQGAGAIARAGRQPTAGCGAGGVPGGRTRRHPGVGRMAFPATYRCDLPGEPANRSRGTHRPANGEVTWKVGFRSAWNWITATSSTPPARSGLMATIQGTTD